MDEVRVPDVVGEVTGWRAWQVKGINERLPLLQSVTHTEMVWHPGHWTLAVCRGGHICGRSDDHRVPGERCSCGLYAARDRMHLMRLGYAATRGPKPVFIGQVGLAGKVIPGEHGHRAEKGRIVRLYVPYEHWRYVEWLERLYEVPVELDNTLKVVR